MKVFDLGNTSWKDTQLFYHTLAYENIEALVLHSCNVPYVCLGLPHNPRDELDMEYCNRNNVPIFRREIGGGTVLLDRNQIFFHLILNRKHPLAPYGQIAFFKKFLKPIINVYKDLGMKVEYKPINDLVVDGKKIAGTGGGEIEDSRVLGSSILLDFDYDLMSRVFKVPNEPFREKVLESMKAHLTTVKKELGYIPSREMIKESITANYVKMFGDFEKGKITDDILKAKADVEHRMMSDKWLYQRGMKQKDRDVKIIQGINVIYRERILNEKRIGLVLEIVNEKVAHVTLTEDGIRVTNMVVGERLLDEPFNEKKIFNTIGKCYGP